MKKNNEEGRVRECSTKSTGMFNKRKRNKEMGLREERGTQHEKEGSH